MNEYENLLKLIALGNPVTILQEPDLVKKFNELLKKDLVEINEEKVVLTKKGEEALNMSVLPSLPSPAPKQKFKKFRKRARIRSKMYFLLGLFLILISIIWILVAHI